MVPAANMLLSALPHADLQRLTPAQSVSLAAGEVLCEVGQLHAYGYFPTTSVITLLCTMENGATAETGLVGNDGMVGVSLFLGGASTPNRAVTLVAGEALRLGASVLCSEFARGGALQRLLLRYTQSLLTQISQTAACNRLHATEKRLCRWLLLCHDLVPSGQFVMTQELIGQMLGARRESVALAAARLEGAGLISYSRGHIRIINRRALESAACECYSVVRSLSFCGTTRKLAGETPASAICPTWETMIDPSQIKEHMEVVGSDGQHVGTVDMLAIKLTKNDPSAGGQHHILSLDTVASVTGGKLQLNVPAAQAREEQISLA